MNGTTPVAKPRLGTVLAFKPRAEALLAGIPARVTAVWPRFPSGDYLVTLEYVAPVRLGNAFVRQIDAFVSELYSPREQPSVHSMD